MTSDARKPPLPPPRPPGPRAAPPRPAAPGSAGPNPPRPAPPRAQPPPQRPVTPPPVPPKQAIPVSPASKATLIGTGMLAPTGIAGAAITRPEGLRSPTQDPSAPRAESSLSKGPLQNVLPPRELKPSGYDEMTDAGEQTLKTSGAQARGVGQFDSSVDEEEEAATCHIVHSVKYIYDPDNPPRPPSGYDDDDDPNDDEADDQEPPTVIQSSPFPEGFLPAAGVAGPSLNYADPPTTSPGATAPGVPVLPPGVGPPVAPPVIYQAQVPVTPAPLMPIDVPVQAQALPVAQPVQPGFPPAVQPSNAMPFPMDPRMKETQGLAYPPAPQFGSGAMQFDVEVAPLWLKILAYATIGSALLVTAILIALIRSRMF